uniref:Uncharacterized protein n=1 Tax=Pyxicephalus adspersus TaxID=30357 RepID=A0AAV2ZWY1_PYXAD|nr:TPA: hypothetical protein GDO54_016974 [Pyxicephalus adspersus]
MAVYILSLKSRINSYFFLFLFVTIVFFSCLVLHCKNKNVQQWERGGGLFSNNFVMHCIKNVILSGINYRIKCILFIYSKVTFS